MYIIILVLGFTFVCGYYIYKVPKEEIVTKEEELAEVDLNVYSEIENILSQEALATNVREAGSEEDTETDTTYIGKIYNSYSLENVTTDLCGVNNSILGNECSFKTSLELQSLYVTLGNSFKEDKNNINNGYPILQWQ